MIKEYQITLFNISGKYKPVSCIIKKDSKEILTKGKETFTKELQKQGIIKICQKRLWTNSDLKKYEYTKVKIREYNKEQIIQENNERDINK